MKLKMIGRSADKKSEAKVLRRQGYIPAALYNRGQASETIAVEAGEFSSMLRKLIPGRLSTTRFVLVDESGKERTVIVKDITYDITTYNVTHLDFEELADDPINVKIPIELVNIADCVGVKLGGVVRQVIRQLKVRCLPKNMPEVLQLDVKNMGLRDAQRLSDLTIPETVRPLVDLNEVAVAIVKR